MKLALVLVFFLRAHSIVSGVFGMHAARPEQKVMDNPGLDGGAEDREACV